MSDSVSAPRRNIELKAKLKSLKNALQVCQELGATDAGVERQRDTYFVVTQGRLKLREIAGEQAVLIAYDRPDGTATRLSRYHLFPVSDPQLLKDMLEGVLGIRSVVEKQRTISLYQNVRIHLDEVTALGTFLEFEAVLSPDQAESDGHSLLAELRERFGIEEDDLLAHSYVDLIESAND